MRHVAHAERGRHVGDLLALGETAGGAGVGLDDVDRPPRQHLAEAPARELTLAAGDGDRLAATHLFVGIELVGHDRLLEPTDVLDGDHAAELHRLDDVETVVGVEHQRHRRTDGAAHRLDEGRVGGDVEADLDLGRREALLGVAGHLAHDVVERIALAQAVGAGGVGLHRRAQRPAHQAMHRLLQQSALQVPQRDVDAGDRGHDETLHALVAERVVERLPDCVRRERVAAGDVRRHGGDDGGAKARGAVAFAPAGGAVRGGDFDDAGLPRGRLVERPRERLGERRLEDVGADSGDLHRTPRVLSPRVRRLGRSRQREREPGPSDQSARSALCMACFARLSCWIPNRRSPRI